MAEVKVQENTKETLETGIAIGAAVLCGAACIAIGYTLGRKEMSETESIMRTFMKTAEKEGEQVMRWINPDGSISRYGLKYLGKAVK